MVFKVDWNKWEQRKSFKETQRQKRKSALREVLESDKKLDRKNVIINLSTAIRLQEEDDYDSDMSDLMEEALMKIADGNSDPQQIAVDVLKKMYGD